jgi:hypothetical protein
MEDLTLDALRIVYPGVREYQLEDRITVRPLSSIRSGR